MKVIERNSNRRLEEILEVFYGDSLVQLVANSTRSKIITTSEIATPAKLLSPGGFGVIGLLAMLSSDYRQWNSKVNEMENNSLLSANNQGMDNTF